MRLLPNPNMAQAAFTLRATAFVLRNRHELYEVAQLAGEASRELFEALQRKEFKKARELVAKLNIHIDIPPQYQELWEGFKKLLDELEVQAVTKTTEDGHRD